MALKHKQAGIATLVQGVAAENNIKIDQTNIEMWFSLPYELFINRNNLNKL